MELDELEKRLDWLDGERKKSNQEIKALREQIASLESTISAQKDYITSLETDIKAVAATTGRIGQFDSALEQTKEDLLHEITAIDKKYSATLRNLEKQAKDDQFVINKRFSEVQTVLPLVAELKKNIQNRIDEENRLSQRLEAINPNFDPIRNSLTQISQEIKRYPDDIQLINKRIVDMQMDNTTLRKRIEEERNRHDLNIESLQKLEGSLKMLLGQEAERRQSQIALMDKVALSQVEKENIWKEWQERIDKLGKIGEDYAAKMAALEATHKAIKQSQTELDEVNIRFDRRINELTEMHRLNEERFRQEWVSFRSDDQKRWTNYQITQDEQTQDGVRRLTKVDEKLAEIEDELQGTKDSIDLITEETEKQLKSLFSVFHDLIESFDQTFNKK